MGQPVDFDRAPADLVELTRQAVAMAQSATERHTLRTLLNRDTLVGEWDADRLSRVLNNLLSNAVKYSPEGGEVLVKLDAEGAPARRECTRVVVHERADVEIAVLLAGEGFVGEAALRARAVLEEVGLTRAGKVRLSLAKVGRARAVLRARLVRSCERQACQVADDDRRELVHVRPTECEMCGGSANRRAGQLAREALLGAGYSRLLVVGGTRTTHAVLVGALGAEIDVRCVDGKQPARAAPTIEADLAWADVMVIWATTPLPHDVSGPYTSRARGQLPWITVARRGVEAICLELVRLCGAT